MKAKLATVVLILIFAANISLLHGQSRWVGVRENVITVNGDGEAMARPDLAVVRLGAQAQAPEAAEAQFAVNETMNKVIPEIERLGVPEESIQTAAMQLSPVYAPHRPGKETEQPKISGYRAENILQVETTDLQLVGKIIDAAMKSGANRLEGVSFQLKDEVPHRTRALKRAVEEAREKAEVIASAVGVRLGPIRNINEAEARIIEPQPMHAMQRAMGGGATPVQPGEIRVHASVTAQYEINRRYLGRREGTPEN